MNDRLTSRDKGTAIAEFTVSATRFDPYKDFEFCVKWDGVYVAGVNKVGVLRQPTAACRTVEAGTIAATRKSPEPTE